MSVPKKYAWLLSEGGPRMILKALELYGVTETVGSKHNPIIMGWAKELGITHYNADEIPWCGLFMAIVAKRSDKALPFPAYLSLRALQWADFGSPVKEPMLGDVLTFSRQGGGHVGLYVGEDASAYHVLGGNQGNQVSITRIAKNRLYRAVRPPYQNPPQNIRKIFLTATGGLSQNEQ